MEIDGAWLGVAGVAVGGGITFVTQQFRIKADIKQANNRRKDEDLRLFQVAVWSSIDSLEKDVGEISRIYEQVGRLTAAEWLPVASYDALQQADLLATRVRNKAVKHKWQSIRQKLHENRKDVERTVWQIPRTSNQEVDQFFNNKVIAWMLVSTAIRDEYDSLNDTIDAVFEDLATPASLLPWKE
jgi:hypothetical protein